MKPIHKPAYPRTRDWLPAFLALITFVILAMWGFLDIVRRLVLLVVG